MVQKLVVIGILEAALVGTGQRGAKSGQEHHIINIFLEDVSGAFPNKSGHPRVDVVLSVVQRSLCRKQSTEATCAQFDIAREVVVIFPCPKYCLSDADCRLEER